MGSIRYLSALLLLVLSTGCGGLADDLLPSGSDRRAAVQPGSTGPLVGQLAPDFTLGSTTGTSVTLSGLLPSTQGVVLYFTMWCPACDQDMSLMQSYVVPDFSSVTFIVIDYVSVDAAAALNSQMSNGFLPSPYTVLADTQQTVLGSFQATMGTTIVIDRTGVVRMNESYKDGSRLRTVLAGLP